MEDQPLVLVEAEGDITSLTLNRPRYRNAANLALLEALDQAIDGVAEQRPRVVLLRAAAPGFCAGIDLNEANGASLAFLRHRVATMHRVLRKLRSLPVPIVAAIDGVCVGLGVELAISADLRVASPASRFSYREPAVAVPSPAHHLVRVIGLTRAQEMLFTARWVEGAEAERFGLVTRLADDAEVGARELARQVVDLAPHAVRATKENIWLSIEDGVSAASLHHIDAVTNSALTEDRQEALDAFKAKRPARFRGR